MSVKYIYLKDILKTFLNWQPAGSIDKNTPINHNIKKKQHIMQYIV